MTSDAVSETKYEIEKRLKANGEYDKMRALVVSSALKALADEDDTTFTNSPDLDAAKKAGDFTAFQVVADFLRAMGLNYTLNVLSLEAGVDKKTLDASRESIAKKVPGATGTDTDVSILAEVLSNATNNKMAPASTTGVTTSAATAAAAAVAAPKKVEAVVPTTVAVNCKILPTTKNAVAKPGKKGDETLYEIYYFDGGIFTRYNQITDQPLQLAELRNCKVYCFDALDSMTVDEVEDSEIVVAACRGSVFLRDCKNVKVTVACKQLRTRDCTNLDVRLFAATDPVVESSSKVTIRPFNLKLPKLTSKFADVGLDPKTNRFVHVYDFTPEKDLPKPHFTVQHPNHGLQIESLGGELGPVEIPTEVEEVFRNTREVTASSESGANKSHNIKTGSGVWTGQGQQTAGAGAQPTATATTPSSSQPQPKATAAPTAKAAAASKPAGVLARDSDSDRYSDFSDDDDMSAASSVHSESDDSF